MRTIKVKGTGKYKGKAEIIEVNFSLITECKTYDLTLKTASDAYQKLKSSLKEINFKDDDLKTIHFSINAVYEQINYENNYKSVFVGYRHVHHLRVEFDFDINRLGKVLELVNRSNAEPNLSINFKLKDEINAKQSLLINAVNNAKDLAVVIAKASGVTLGEIIDIIYDWTDFNIYSQTRYDSEKLYLTSTLKFDITPEDIVLTDYVTVIWEIK